MCNQLPVRYFTIPKTGVGYKVFSRMSDGRYNTLYFSQHRYDRADNSGWVHFKRVEDEAEHGFCFFTSEQEAEDFAQSIIELRGGKDALLYDIIVRKIEYEGGLGRFKTDRISKNYSIYETNICLCKSFRIIKKDE